MSTSRACRFFLGHMVKHHFCVRLHFHCRNHCAIVMTCAPIAAAKMWSHTETTFDHVSLKSQCDAQRMRELALIICIDWNEWVSWDIHVATLGNQQHNSNAQPGSIWNPNFARTNPSSKSLIHGHVFCCKLLCLCWDLTNCQQNMCQSQLTQIRQFRTSILDCLDGVGQSGCAL